MDDVCLWSSQCTMVTDLSLVDEFCLHDQMNVRTMNEVFNGRPPLFDMFNI